MSDHGVHEHDEHFAGTTAPKGNGPSCAWCGHHDRSVLVNRPDGKYLCGCGSLHNGTDAEWRQLAEHRKHAIGRRSRGSKE